MATLKKQIDFLKADLGSAKLALMLGVGSTETINRWARNGLPKRKKEAMKLKIEKLYMKRSKS